MVDIQLAEEDLKKTLEWELSLEDNDLRSHAWYHGTIPRQRAEQLLREDGHFLIRDCISRPGDFVLTCLCRGMPLHFVINKALQHCSVYERVQYQFEDECFDTVPDLVTYYVGSKKAISEASGAVISRPVNRSNPLSYCTSPYVLQSQAVRTPEQNAYNVKTPSPSELPFKPGNYDGNCIGKHSLKTTQMLDTQQSNIAAFATLRPHHYQTVAQELSDSTSGPLMEQKSWEVKTSSKASAMNREQPPPKPSRVPSIKYTYKPVVNKQERNVQHSASEMSTSVKEHPKKGETGLQYSDSQAIALNSESNDVLKAFCFDDRVKHTSLPRRTHHLTSEYFFIDDAGFTSSNLTIPNTCPPSHFNLSDFNTFLLPPDNRPLESSTLLKVRNLLKETGARILAHHLTKTDLEVVKLSSNCDLGFSVTSGLEFLTLPQGAQLQLDLLDRLNCLKYFVAVTILTCGGEAERAVILNKWIQVALDTKTALGNLFGFAGIMQGLSLPQVARLRSTWFSLRTNFTEVALTYESKLRPTMKTMEECSNPLAPNTCIPYLVSLVTILQRHNDLQHEVEPIGEKLATNSKETERPLTLGLPWEQKATDYGLQIMLTHLEMGRIFIQQSSTYRRNSEIVLESLKCHKQLLDLFRTEFHLRFLWGTKGATVDASERCSKFNQLLAVMSERCESN
ncbi:SH2 domain-containing protein 3C-like [Limulus polyphemus]|uniref:SH2 domain-containing protein 3C-like n=1 Tax=Limulus polyphemus TaxID=6850 RepID=A0ABM1RWE0_LIMPO|nr:SH2 domain-containing protein 3C-like [Limulus polyphemus]XP_022235696.1 SH2 domain-containing protein 3C-like [Limulus polyphemus]XP_022235697.1 SH2 domain-containing protein 3C-like [Limulus polyphemus]XP_022235698.1 SH2 domain-containing protein 3C-like [Limulus polyphemus]